MHMCNNDRKSKNSELGTEVSILTDNSDMYNKDVISITLKSKTESLDKLMKKATDAFSSRTKVKNREVLEWIK